MVDLTGATTYRGAHVRLWLSRGISEEYVLMDDLPRLEEEANWNNIDVDILEEDITLYLCDIGGKSKEKTLERWDNEGYTYRVLLPKDDIEWYHSTGTLIAVEGIGSLEGVPLWLKPIGWAIEWWIRRNQE